MKKDNNKGYTLVELMLTLLIFSVIMVSIIAIMRTAIVSYKNGLTEASVQENAQIAVNQISNILVDVGGFSAGSSGNAESNPWTFKHPTYGTVELKVNETYKMNPDGTIYVADDGSTVRTGGTLLLKSEIIAEHVMDFDIKGLYKTADPATNPVDNAAVISLTVDDGHGGHQYKVEKVVYFRNNVENVDNYMYDVINADDGGGSTVVVGGAKEQIDRYEEFDLTTNYGIISVEPLDSITGTNYEFVDGITTASATPDDNPGIKITTKGALNTEYLTKKVDPKETTDPTCNKVVGYNADGDTIEVVLYTPYVKIDDSIGVVDVRNQPTNNGFHTTVPVDGIDIYNGIAKGKIKVYIDQTFKAGTDSVNYSYQLANSNDPAVGEKAPQMTFPDAMKNKGYGDNIQIGMVGDVNSHGLTITTNNRAIGDQASIVTSLSSVLKELNFDITIKEVNPGGSEVERYNKEHKFNLIIAGESLEAINN